MVRTAATSTVAATAAGTAGLAAGGAVGATDTLDTFFLCPDQIPDHKADDDHEHSNNQNIFHILLLSAQGILSLELFVGIDTQIHNNGNHNSHSDQTTYKAGAEGTGGDQGTDLIDQNANSEAHTELQTDAGPEPLAVLQLRVHGADGSKAGGSEQVEHQVS